MNRMRIFALLALLAGAAACAYGEIAILGSSQPVTLAEIAGTPTLITVTFKDSGARDTNLKLLAVHSDRIVVLTSHNDEVPYLIDTIESITLQDGAIERRHIPEMETQVLRAEHQRVVDRAWARIREIYHEAKDNQQLRIHAAVCLALINDLEAHNYLRQLAESNDIITQLEAAGALYLAGDDISDSLLQQGLESGNRNARAMAASLAGLAGFEQGVERLNILFQDRAVQLSTPATRALARLGQTHIVPRVLDMLQELHTEKGEAAIFALTNLADEHVLEQLKFRLLEAEGMMRLRIVRILYNLHDPLGKDELRYIHKNYPTLTPEVALLLAKDGDWDATQYLRNRLSRREDPTIPNLRYRARNAQSLLKGGDPTAMAVFQELLRSNEAEVFRFVFELVVELGDPRLITLLQPGVETANRDFAFGACQTVIALAFSQFRERLLLYREEFDY